LCDRDLGGGHGRNKEIAGSWLRFGQLKGLIDDGGKGEFGLCLQGGTCQAFQQPAPAKRLAAEPGFLWPKLLVFGKDSSLRRYDKVLKRIGSPPTGTGKTQGEAISFLRRRGSGAGSNSPAPAGMTTSGSPRRRGAASRTIGSWHGEIERKPQKKCETTDLPAATPEPSVAT